MNTIRIPLETSRPLTDLGRLRRTRPRAYEEWCALHRWGRLPPWEDDPPGYLLRLARESRGITQTEMGRKLTCSQQAIARAERWESNPTIRFIRRWCRALEMRLTIEIQTLEP